MRLISLWFAGIATAWTSAGALEAEPPGRGPYAVGTTNMEVAAEHADLNRKRMHAILLGQKRFLTDILAHPDAAWTLDVPVPDDDAYGPARGKTLPVVSFIAYPSAGSKAPNRYRFPYEDGQYGDFEDMLKPGEAPVFADPDARYPLVVLAHGMSAHGLYDVQHAQDLASNGYIVAVLTYGDDRTMKRFSDNDHVSFLRPLLTRAVLDSILDSETFGPHIDADNIGITGHSFGGFTSLAMAGGRFQGNPASVTDERIKAAVLAAPWVGGNFGGNDVFAFGDENRELNQVTVPVLCAYGTRDDVTLASFILPAMQQLGGPTYVVELVDQPHVFDGGSWEDRNGWELLFFNAYLKGDAAALETVKTARSMKGGNEDVQLFDYQRASSAEAFQ